MKIYSMTATFGKLDHETLTLEPGLNVIHAPNEWGKSTWCAFLVAMLYGIETRTHTTKTVLSDKERYAPWSGAPMSGRIDLNWTGRDITIERRTKGRSVFGEFKAYETQTGLAIPELTAANCGQMLLGVEKSVFQRAGFIRMTDLPVTQDESLRRRLNALVTTGDDSGAADELAQKLKDLKNRCRFNRTGLLPQAEAQRDQLIQKLQQIEALQSQTENFKLRQQQLEDQIAQLENHKAAMLYAQSQADLRHLEEAEQTLAEAAAREAELEDLCAQLPLEETARQNLQRLQQLLLQEAELDARQEAAPPQPMPVVVPDVFADPDPAAALAQTQKDYAAWKALCRPLPLLLLIPIAAAVVLGWLLNYLTYGIVAATVLALLCLALTLRRVAAVRNLEGKYAPTKPEYWQTFARDYAERCRSYDRAVAAWKQSAQSLALQRTDLEESKSALLGDLPREEAEQLWQQALRTHTQLENARQEHIRCIRLRAVAKSLIKKASPPAMADTMTLTIDQTNRLLAESLNVRQQLQLQLGRCQGQIQQLGHPQQLQQQLEQIQSRIERLEDTCAALTIAQQTLTQASQELQRRFAPRITHRAQALFAQLTAGRYDRLTWSQDLSLSAGAREEDTLRSALWRSDGTVDQLYLALRLAVAEELTPQAPLVLDDALVRFDDARLAAAMDILRQTGQQKQVLLFTCQERESQTLAALPRN